MIASFKNITVLLCVLVSLEVYSRPCSCDITIKSGQNFADANKLKVKPGDIICLEAGRKRFLQLRNFHGDSLNPLVFVNKGGQVVIEDANHYYGFMMENCRYFRLTGTGDPKHKYGILIKKTGPRANGLSLGGGSSDFEVDHIEVSGTGFAGIVSKTDPDCEERFTRDNFLMKNVSFHHNYVHDVAGEGFYIGNSFYSGWDKNKRCEGTVLYPHEIHNLQIYENIVENTGWDGIQVGCATLNTVVRDNVIHNFGIKGKAAQGNGIQVGEGTAGVFCNNIVNKGSGNGMIVLGLGDILLFNNLILHPGTNGFFCDSRVTRDSSEVAFVNNTIIFPGEDGFRIYNRVTLNNIYNNIVLMDKEKTNLDSVRAYRYVHLHTAGVHADTASNMFTTSIKSLSLKESKFGPYKPHEGSPTYGSGKDVRNLMKKYNCNGFLNAPEKFHIGILPDLFKIKIKQE